MATIEIHYNQKTPEIIQADEVVSGQRGSMEVQFTFSPDWDEYPIRSASFVSRAASRLWPLDEENKAKIPASVIRAGVRSFTVSVFGVRETESGQYERYNGKPASFRVEIGGKVPGEGCEEDATAYEQLLIRVTALDEAVAETYDALASKLDINQGTDNAGRVLVVGEDGMVAPGEYAGGGGSGGIEKETDPTVPAWAKQPEKPTYTAEEVGAQPKGDYALRNEIPSVPVQSVNGKTGAVKLTAGDVGARPSTWMPSASDVGALPASTKIPAKTSDLQNDSGYITKAVADLVNYYTKSQTYTQAEINAKISAIPKFSISVVSALPTTGISETTIYLLKAGNASGDLYTEYIYTGGAWEILGSQRVDLTGYATETWVEGKLADYIPESELQNAINTALAQAKESGEFDGEDGKSGVYVGSDPIPEGYNVQIDPDGAAVELATKEDVDALAGEVADLGGAVTIPDYWETHIAEKIETIKALHKQYGRDCYSFVMIADSHYTSNLGRRAPMLAKRIMDDTQIKFAISNGDMQTRGCHNTKDELLVENEDILNMFKPILSKTLFQKGNHDGAYGRLDRNGDGTISNVDDSGNILPEAERETYVHNLTPQEFHEYLYRKVGMVGDIHFDETGSAYYIDDTANNVRFIGLNTQCNDYELQADGTQKYPTMWLVRFTQPQFDFLINKALSNLDDETNVVLFGHVPLTQEIGDREVMLGVLNAFKNKITYSGIYEGTASGGAMYENKAESDPDNTTDTTKWVNEHRISSSGVTSSGGTGKSVCNPIFLKSGDIIRIKGVSFAPSVDRCMLSYTNVAGQQGNNINYVSSLPNSDFGYTEVGGIHIFECLFPDTLTDVSVRFSFSTPTDASQVIITVNEEIVESAHGYDYVSVDCDFSESKGKLVGYFAGHVHKDSNTIENDVPVITTRCDAREENDAALKAERIEGTITEQSFDVFTVTPDTIYATKIGAGTDREIDY